MMRIRIKGTEEWIPLTEFISGARTGKTFGGKLLTGPEKTLARYPGIDWAPCLNQKCANEFHFIGSKGHLECSKQTKVPEEKVPCPNNILSHGLHIKGTTKHLECIQRARARKLNPRPEKIKCPNGVGHGNHLLGSDKYKECMGIKRQSQ